MKLQEARRINTTTFFEAEPNLYGFEARLPLFGFPAK